MSSTPRGDEGRLTKDDIKELNPPEPSFLGKFGRFTGFLNDTTKPEEGDTVIRLLKKYEATKVLTNKPLLIEAMKRIFQRSEISRKECDVTLEEAERFNELTVEDLLGDLDIQEKMRMKFQADYDGGRRRKTRRRKARRSTRRRKTSRR